MNISWKCSGTGLERGKARSLPAYNVNQNTNSNSNSKFASLIVAYHATARRRNVQQTENVFTL